MSGSSAATSFAMFASHCLASADSSVTRRVERCGLATSAANKRLSTAARSAASAINPSVIVSRSVHSTPSEKQPRAVRLGEATALADVFDTSLDTLLGRSVSPRKSATYAVRALAAAAEQASWQVSSIETTLRDRIDELVAEYPTDEWMKALVSGCERACDQLAEAHSALHDALNSSGPDSKVKQLIRTMLLKSADALRTVATPS